MKANDKLRALIDAYSELAEYTACSERGTMESLLDIFDPEELVNLGYYDRVKAYFDEYGAGDELDGITPPDEDPRQGSKPLL